VCLSSAGCLQVVLRLQWLLPGGSWVDNSSSTSHLPRRWQKLQSLKVNIFIGGNDEQSIQHRP
jgi:hypothetical protein